MLHLALSIIFATSATALPQSSLGSGNLGDLCVPAGQTPLAANCKAGLFCNFSSTSSAFGICVSIRQLGDACGGSTMVAPICAGGLLCLSQPTESPDLGGTCVSSPAAAGQLCGRGNINRNGGCAQDLVCVPDSTKYLDNTLGTCKTVVGFGQQCNLANVICAPNLVCVPMNSAFGAPSVCSTQ